MFFLAGLLAAAAGIQYSTLEDAADVAAALDGHGLRLAELRTDRAEGTKLRAAISQACAAVLSRPPMIA